MSTCEVIKHVAAGDLAARFVAGVIDKKTGDVIQPEHIFEVDVLGGWLVRYVYDEDGKPKIARDEKGIEIAAKERLEGDFVILWKDDAP